MMMCHVPMKCEHDTGTTITPSEKRHPLRVQDHDKVSFECTGDEKQEK
jgi:hypothetical protein